MTCTIYILAPAKLIVPSVISIIGFVLTYYSMCKQFRNSIEQQLTEEQRKVYLDTYGDVEKIVTTNEIIFQRIIQKAVKIILSMCMMKMAMNMR